MPTPLACSNSIGRPLLHFNNFYPTSLAVLHIILSIHFCNDNIIITAQNDRAAASRAKPFELAALGTAMLWSRKREQVKTEFLARDGHHTRCGAQSKGPKGTPPGHSGVEDDLLLFIFLLSSGRSESLENYFRPKLFL